MGDWNQTCGLSRLAIRPGDKVVLLILNQSTESNCYGNGFCYSNEIHKPVVTPIKAEYFNYGEFKNVEENLLVKSYLNKIVDYKLKEIPESNFLINNYLDNIISNPLNIQEINFSIEDIVNYLINQGDLPGISYMVFHRNLFYGLIKDFGNRILFDKEIPYREFLTECFHRNLEYIQSRLTSINGESFIDLIKILKSVNKLDIIKDDLIDLIIFDRLMNVSRMYYTPQSGVGSQCEEYEVHRIIAEFVLNFSEDIFRNEFKEDKELTRKKVFEHTLFS